LSLTIDTETTNEEAHDRKALVNSVVLRARAPRNFAKVDDYRERMRGKAEGLEFPCGPGCAAGCAGACAASKAALLRNVMEVQRREPAEYEEFKDHLFSRHGAYRIR
jgi:hypothetical protein